MGHDATFIEEKLQTQMLISTQVSILLKTRSNALSSSLHSKQELEVCLEIFDWILDIMIICCCGDIRFYYNPQ